MEGEGEVEGRLEVEDRLEVEGRLEVQVCKPAMACTLEVVEVDMLGRGDRKVQVCQWVQV